MSKLSAKRKKMLLEARRASIKFRDANCGFYFDPEGGTVALVAHNGCFLQATAVRAKELSNLTPESSKSCRSQKNIRVRNDPGTQVLKPCRDGLKMGTKSVIRLSWVLSLTRDISLSFCRLMFPAQCSL
jgi:hypothetical protein